MYISIHRDSFMDRNKLICFPGEIMLQQLMEQLLNIKSLGSLYKNIQERKKFKMEVRFFSIV